MKDNIDLTLRGFFNTFLKDNENLLKENKLNEIYERLRDFNTIYIPELTLYLMNLDVNPLLYLKSIPSFCFYRFNIPSLIIPSNIKYINNQAFKNIKSDNITISSGVKIIDNYVFNNSNISSIYIPKSIAYIGYDIFDNAHIGEIKYEGSEQD